MSNNIDSYCYKKRSEQAQYKKLATAGNNPIITSRGAYSQAQLSRSSVSTLIPVTLTYLAMYYYDQTQSEELFLSQMDANQFFLKKGDAMTDYLSVVDAQLNYLSLDNANNNYLKKIDASNNYLSRLDASHNYLALKDASNSFLQILDASNTYARQIYADQINNNVQKIGYLSFNDQTTISGNIRVGGIDNGVDPFTIPKITITGNILIGNPTINDANTQRIQLGDVTQINGGCRDILITPKANGNVIIGGAGNNNGCRVDINNGANDVNIGAGAPGNGFINIGGTTVSHSGNINIGTSTVATNKVNIGSTTIPTYINGTIRIKNQYTNASSSLITGNIVLSMPCNSAYSISIPEEISETTITLPQATVSDIGLRIVFVRVGGDTTKTVSFIGSGTQTIYDKQLTSYSGSSAALMTSTINMVTFIYMKGVMNTYGWFQI